MVTVTRQQQEQAALAEVGQLAAELAKAAKEEVVEHADGSITVKLRAPILRKNERIEALTLRRPTAGDIVKLNLVENAAGNPASSVEFLAAISNLSTAEVEEMDGADFMFVAGEAVRRFVRRRPA